MQEINKSNKNLAFISCYNFEFFSYFNRSGAVGCPRSSVNYNFWINYTRCYNKVNVFIKVHNMNELKNWSWMQFILSKAEGWRVFCFFFGGEKRKITKTKLNLQCSKFLKGVFKVRLNIILLLI